MLSDKKAILNKLYFLVMAFIMLSIPNFTLGNPISLSSTPVLESSAAPPNVMLLIDNSEAMNELIPDTDETRLDLAKEAAINLVNELTEMRVGLSIFNQGNGAWILVGIGDITQNRNNIISRISSINTQEAAPLAESLLQIGRYFVEDHNNLLTLHPDTQAETKANAYTVFNQVAKFNQGVNNTSPIQYYCQKSFIILITAGLPTEDRDISSSTGLQDYDGDCVDRVPPCENTTVDETSEPSFDMKPPESGYIYPVEAGDGSSDYVDDVAGALFDIDLRPDLKAPEGVDKKNNIATYPVGFTQDNKLMQAIATNGGGEYFYADDSNALIEALNQVAATISDQSGTAASVAFNSTSLSKDSAIYLASYNTQKWHGNLIKKNLDSEGNVTSTAWQAASILDNTPTSSRVILTYNRDTTQAIPFKTLSALSLAEQNDLKQDATDDDAQARLDYLRGDRQLEGKTLRERASLLGDIVNSSPVVVGEPQLDWPDTPPFPTGSNSYSQFKEAEKDRKQVVYVGANDGMLHGFDGDTGKELLAYIPSSVFSDVANQGLHWLTSTNYEHRFYVDLTPSVADAYIKIQPSGSVGWHSILVGGDRNGGNGYFALDVTNPGQFTETNANNLLLWEFTSLDDTRLGRSYSQPVIGLMNNGRWAAIFGNGYNATGTNTAELFIVYLDGGLNGQWIEGQDYMVFDTKSGTSSSPNGLTSPAAIDINGDGVIDRIYAGDINGQLWAFDVSDQNASNWKVAYGQSSNPKPLFTAPSGQSITSKVTVVKNPEVGNGVFNAPNMIVMFGTGKLLASSDKMITSTQSFYGIWDHGKNNIRRTDLVAQTYTVINGKRTLSNNAVRYQSIGINQSDDGWYIDFTGGERIITTPFVVNDVVFFNTVIPSNDTPCSFGGSGWLMVANVSNGGQPQFVVFDVNNDDELNDNDKINGNFISGLYYQSGVPMGSKLLGDQLYTSLSDTSLDKRKVFTAVKTGRISWKEIQRN